MRCLVVCLILGGALAAQASSVRFDISPLNLGIFGAQFTADYLAPPNGQQLEARAHLVYTTGSLDAADLRFQFQAPTTGVPVWEFTGADLGWSGFGSFSADPITHLTDGAIDLGDPPPGASLYALTLSATGFQPLSGSLAGSYFEVDIDPWADLGEALPPLLGSAPSFDPDGTLAAGTPLTLALADAPSAAATFLVASTQQVTAPFKQGVLVPAPDFLFARTADAAGDVTLALVWPAGIPAGVPLYLQWWVQDASAPAGFSASRAFKAVTP